MKTGPDIPAVSELSFLASGGFGEVWAGVLRDRRVVVKVARRPSDPRARREARALERVGPPVAPALLGEGRSTAASRT